MWRATFEQKCTFTGPTQNRKKNLETVLIAEEVNNGQIIGGERGQQKNGPWKLLLRMPRSQIKR
jgi:hypothetical protein